MICCDNCGNSPKVLVMKKAFPFATASTSAGEDATMCKKCLRTMLEEKQMSLLDYCHDKLLNQFLTTPNTNTKPTHTT